jgi:predicted nucleic acid-binding Zn ribbon protein
MNDDPLRLRDVLRSEGNRLGIEAAVETGVIFSRWPKIVGDGVAAHARPSSLRHGVLRVRADSPVWATEISYLASEIQRRANDEVRATVVKEVRVWWAPGGTEVKTAPAGGAKEAASSSNPRGRASGGDPAGALERARRAWRARGGGAPGPR